MRYALKDTYLVPEWEPLRITVGNPLGLREIQNQNIKCNFKEKWYETAGDRNNLWSEEDDECQELSG